VVLDGDRKLVFGIVEVGGEFGRKAVEDFASSRTAIDCYNWGVDSFDTMNRIIQMT